MTTQRRQEHGFVFEKMIADHLPINKSDDIKFDCVYDNIPMQLKTTVDSTIRLGRYKNGLEISKDFYLVYARHKGGIITEAQAYLIDGLAYNRQFSFSVLHYFEEHIKPLPDRSGKYTEYCSDLKFMAKDRLVNPAVKKGGGGNNRLQSVMRIDDIPKLGSPVDLGLGKFFKIPFDIL